MKDNFNELFKSVVVTVDDVRRKINSLRTQFFAEHNKISKSKVSGSGTDDIYISTLWCYDLLSFLNDSTQTRQSQSNLDDQTNATSLLLETEDTEGEVIFEGCVDDVNNSMLPEISNSRPSTSQSQHSEGAPPNKKRKNEQQTKTLDLITKATQVLDATSSPPAAPQLSTVSAFAM